MSFRWQQYNPAPPPRPVGVGQIQDWTTSGAGPSLPAYGSFRMTVPAQNIKSPADVLRLAQQGPAYGSSPAPPAWNRQPQFTPQYPGSAAPPATAFSPQPRWAVPPAPAPAPAAAPPILDWTSSGPGPSQPKFQTHHVVVADNIPIKTPADAERVNELMRASYVPKPPTPKAATFGSTSPILDWTSSGAGPSQPAFQTTHVVLAENVPINSAADAERLNALMRAATVPTKPPPPKAPAPAPTGLYGARPPAPPAATPPPPPPAPAPASPTVLDWTTTGPGPSRPAHEEVHIVLAENVPINSQADADRLNELMRSAQVPPKPPTPKASVQVPAPSPPSDQPIDIVETTATTTTTTITTTTTVVTAEDTIVTAAAPAAAPTTQPEPPAAPEPPAPEPLAPEPPVPEPPAPEPPAPAVAPAADPEPPAAATTSEPAAVDAQPAVGEFRIEDWTASGVDTQLSGWESLHVLVPPPAAPEPPPSPPPAPAAEPPAAPQPEPTLSTSAPTAAAPPNDLAPKAPAPAVASSTTAAAGTAPHPAQKSILPFLPDIPFLAPNTTFIISQAATLPGQAKPSYTATLMPSQPFPGDLASLSQSFSETLRRSGSGAHFSPSPSGEFLQPQPSYQTLPYHQPPITAGSFHASPYSFAVPFQSPPAVFARPFSNEALGPQLHPPYLVPPQHQHLVNAGSFSLSPMKPSSPFHSPPASPMPAQLRRLPVHHTHLVHASAAGSAAPAPTPERVFSGEDSRSYPAVVSLSHLSSDPAFGEHLGSSFETSMDLDASVSTRK